MILKYRIFETNDIRDNDKLVINKIDYSKKTSYWDQSRSS